MINKKNFKLEHIRGFYILAFSLPFVPLILADIFSPEILSLANNLIKLYLIVFTVYATISLQNRKLNFLFLLLYFLYLIGSFISRKYFSAIDPNFILKDIILDALIPMSIILVQVTMENISIFKEPIRKVGKLLLYIFVFSLVYALLFDFGEIIKLLTGTKNYFVLYDSFYLNRNSFAQFLFLSITQLIIFKKVILKKIDSKIYIILIGFSVLSLLITLSRTALISTGLFLFLYYIINHIHFDNKKNILVPITIIVLSCILIEVVTYLIFDFSLISKVLRLEFGLSGRADLWKISLEAFGKNPIFGVGMMNARSLLYYYGNANTQFHNMFFEQLASNGIIGVSLQFVAFSYFIGLIYLKLRRCEPKIAMTYLALVLSILFYSLSESINIFGLGYVSTIFTVVLFLLPLLQVEEEFQHEKHYI